jgi:hypothetical protein
MVIFYKFLSGCIPFSSLLHIEINIPEGEVVLFTTDCKASLLIPELSWDWLLFYTRNQNATKGNLRESIRYHCSMKYRKGAIQNEVELGGCRVPAVGRFITLK